MSAKGSEVRIHRFLKAYVESKKGELTGQSSEAFTIRYPDQKEAVEYTYDTVLSREKKVTLMAPGSPAFQQVLKECLDGGNLCQVQLKPKDGLETLIKNHFKEEAVTCKNCDSIDEGGEAVHVCVENQSCYHQIHNGKIASVKTVKSEPVKYYHFYFNVIFQNRLRPKNEEIVTVLLDEKGMAVSAENFDDQLINCEEICFEDHRGKLKPEAYDALKNVADEKLESILRDKLVLFDLPLAKEKKAKLKSFDRRLRRERREQVISRKHEFDYPKWRANYEALLRREEESLITNITAKLSNLLIINTAKTTFEITLDNNSTLHSSFILGIDHTWPVTCPLCKKEFSEGYATQDGLYVCGDCVRQSVDTSKFYSKKAALKLDETLNEYLEKDAGFVCSVCGKRHSRLLEFKCSHDNSSICIYHYDHCDVCGKKFSKLNLTYTDEFKRKLCPKHSGKEKQGEP